MRYNIAINDKKFETQVGEISNGLAHVIVNGKSYEVLIENYADVESGGAPPVKQVKTPAPAASPAGFKTTPFFAENGCWKRYDYCPDSGSDYRG